MLTPSKSLWHFPFISMESESTESRQESICLVVLLSAIRIYAYMSPDEERRHFNECYQWKDGTSMSCHVLKHMLHKYEGRLLLDLIVLRWTRCYHTHDERGSGTMLLCLLFGSQISRFRVCMAVQHRLISSLCLTFVFLRALKWVTSFHSWSFCKSSSNLPFLFLRFHRSNDNNNNYFVSPNAKQSFQRMKTLASFRQLLYSYRHVFLLDNKNSNMTSTHVVWRHTNLSLSFWSN